MVNILQRLREKLNLTQEDVACAMDRTINTIQNWEKKMKFKTPEDLHELLDFYGVNDNLRAMIVQTIYGRQKSNKSVYEPDLKHLCFLDNDNNKMLNSAFDYYNNVGGGDFSLYPIDRVVDAIEVIEGRINCLKAAIAFIRKAFIEKSTPNIYGMKSAKCIDMIAEEYGIVLDAEKTFMISEANSYINQRFPFGMLYDYKVFIPEFGKKLSYEEYFEEVKEKAGEIRRPLDDAIFMALNNMDDEIYNLECVRNAGLTYILESGFARGEVDDEYMIQMSTRSIWELIVIKPLGKSFKTVPTVESLDELFINKNLFKNVVLDNRPFNIEDTESTVYVDSGVFYSKELVVKSSLVLENVTGHIIKNEDYLSEDDWLDYCCDSDKVQNYIDLFVENYTTWRD